MHGVGTRDGELRADWGRTSEDYGRYRPGYPASFFERLAALGVPLPSQRILDLGTGTGVLAREFSRHGARVLGIDIAGAQVVEARRLAHLARLDTAFLVGSADAIPARAATFELATASQCWLYFDPARTVTELRRVLVPDGRLLTCHISWLPLADSIAAATEALVLRHNPDWSAGGYDGRVWTQPDGTQGLFDLEASFMYDEEISFTRESWRGRIRACRGIGATLPPSRVAAFDAELDSLLVRLAPEEFKILHRIDAHLLRVRGACPA